MMKARVGSIHLLCALLTSTAFLRAALSAPEQTHVTPFALAQAEQAPFGSDPLSIVRGEGTWQNAGPDPHKVVNRMPLNAAFPSWFTLVWPESIPLSRLRLRTNADQVKFFRFKGAEGENPALAPEGSWQVVRSDASAVRGKEENESVHEFDMPAGTATRALKVQLLEVKPRNSKIAWISEFSVWGKPPSQPFETISDVAPVTIPCDYVTAGEAALMVEDAKGRHVRNLLAQVERKAGQSAEPWDLKDEDGRYVAPGTYRYRWTVGPKPELVYQMTPYPNVADHSPESKPWGGEPSDGWLSDHGNQWAVCVIGERVYIAASSTEGGHSLLECDLQGRKVWGYSPGAFAGYQRLFTDGSTLFLQNGDQVFRMDPATRKVIAAVNLDQGATRKGAVVGLAARENRVYATYWSRLPRLDNATRGDAVDLDACLPKLPASVKRSDNYGIPLSPQRDFLSFLRLHGDFVAGDARNTLYLESTKGKGPRQHILLGFKEPVAIGSLVFPQPEIGDLDFTMSALKPDAPWPPDPRRAKDWLPITLPKLTAWNCVPLPEKLKTRALCLTFSQPGADLMADAGVEEEGLTLEKDSAKDDSGLWGDAWCGRMEGLRLLRARFENAAPAARVRVNSGTYDPKTGEWDAKRQEPLSEENPGVFLMEWDKPQTLNGLALKEVDGEVTKIDVFSGDGEPELTGMKGWETVAEYLQMRRNFYQPGADNNSDALYLDGTVDFGKDVTTKAVRLRVVKQWGEGGSPAGIRRDRGGRNIEPSRCRIYGVAALRPLGGEVPLDPLAYQRLVVFDGASGKQLSEKPSVITGSIEFRHKDGALFGLVGSQLMRINEDPAKPTPFITDLLEARRGPIAFDPAGKCYVWDHATDRRKVRDFEEHPGEVRDPDGDTDRRQVRVYDEAGTYLRSIGKPGPKGPGAYDPAVLSESIALAASGTGDLYSVYPHDNPRRVSHFRQDGTFVQDFLGNPGYGGGGTLDPHDSSRLYYLDLRFHLDWETGKTRLDSEMSAKGREETSGWGWNLIRNKVEAIVVEGRRYLVTAPLLAPSINNPFQVVCVYDEKARRLRVAAAVGDGGAFPYLQKPEFLKATGGKPVGDFSFIWADSNGDGEVQAAETVLTPKSKNEDVWVGRADAKLGFWSGAARYEVKEFLPDGTPVYERRPMPFWAQYHMPNGNHFRFGHRGGKESGEGINEVLDPQGRQLWSYRAGWGMDGLNVPPWQPGRVDLQFGIAGFGKVMGDLGDIFVIAANNGQWNLWTADGLLAGHLTLHTRDPRVKGWPAEHARGTKMGNITAGQEHFNYFFTQAADGKFYAIIGGGSINVMEVQGLERIRRGEAEIEVTPEMIQKTQAWEARRAQLAIFTRPVVQECSHGEPALDGRMNENEWPAVTRIGDWATFGMRYDAERLYLGWSVQKRGAFTNGGEEFQRCFKTGAAVDVQLGTRAEAPPERRDPEAGDLRILVTRLKGKLVAVLYRPVAPDAPKSERYEPATLVAKTTIDQVRILESAVIKVQEAGDGYGVEASIPLKDLGLAPTPGRTLKMDWGVLTTNDGFITSTRTYWANQTATGVSDEALEARLQPGLWGHMRFVGPQGLRGIDDMLKSGDTNPGFDKTLDDLELE